MCVCLCHAARLYLGRAGSLRMLTARRTLALLQMHNCTHFELYNGAPLAAALAEQTAFLKEHLLVPAAGAA